MNPWKPDTSPRQARRIGKTSEEVNELGAVLARISIQGVDEVDPASGKTNRQRMVEEMADVMAQIELNLDFFEINDAAHIAFERRVIEKKRQMREWEAHFLQADALLTPDPANQTDSAVDRYIQTGDLDALCRIGKP